MEDGSWHWVGAHQFRLEERDILHFRIDGDVSGPELEHVVRAGEAIATQVGRQFWLLDVARLGSADRDARRFVADFGVKPWFAGTVVYNASFLQRAVVRMAVTAGKLLARIDTPLHFFSTEKEARGWIEAERRRLGPLANPAAP